MASIEFEKARNNSESVMAGAVALHFPAFDDLPEKTFYFGTRRFEVDGEEYNRALADMPYIRTQKGLGQDGAEFSVNDPESEWYEQLKPYEDVVVDTSCTIKECLLTEIGLFESETVLPGFLEQMTLNESSLQINFSAISDMSRTGFLTGGRILSQRYCAAAFNKNGLLSPLISACGWQTAQGGNPLFCTHKLKGVDGCEDHFNDHRYFAVEALTSAEITNTSGGGGFSYGLPCFTPRTLIWMADDTYKPIYQVKEGDWVWSFTPLGELVIRKVCKTFTHLVDSFLMFDFGRSRHLEVTPEHRICIAPDLFKTASSFDPGDTVRIRCGGDWFDFVLRNNWLEERRTRVHNFHVEHTETYFVVLADGTKVAVHNRKDPILIE